MTALAEQFLADHVVRHLPSAFVGAAGRRYIAGPSRDDAIRTATELNGRGCDTTLDVLGEETTTPEQASATTAEYRELAPHLAPSVRRPNVSLKLTALGLNLGRDECERNLEAVCSVAERHGVSVHLDMEQAVYTDRTFQIYDRFKARYPKTGMTLQACLRRTRDDAKWAVSLGATVRLCKGIYLEPSSIAFRDADEIRRQYLATLEILLAGGCYVEIATHDRWLLDRSERMVQEHGLAPNRYEFQMLLGVTHDAQGLLRSGHPLRIYVPYGKHWRKYVERRIHENPRILRHVARNMMLAPQVSGR